MKTKKTTLCAHFWLFLHIFMQTRILLKNLLVSLFFYFLVSIAVKDFRNKALNRFRKKLVTDTQTDRLMEDQTSLSS